MRGAVITREPARCIGGGARPQRPILVRREACRGASDRANACAGCSSRTPLVRGRRGADWVRSSSSTSALEASTSSAASTASDKDDGKVRILFTTEYVCSEGESLFLVGDQPSLGLWDPQCGIPLRHVGGTEESPDSTWQASISLDKGGPYEFKFIAVSDGGRVVRWQDGSNRVINIPRKVPSNHGFVAHVPWEGITLVSKAAETLEIDALESLGSLQKRLEMSPQDEVSPREAVLRILEEVEAEEDSLAEASSRAVDSAVRDLNATIDTAEAAEEDPTSIESLRRDIEIAAASRRVVITMELMQEQELRKQLAAGEGKKEKRAKEAEAGEVGEEE